MVILNSPARRSHSELPGALKAGQKTCPEWQLKVRRNGAE